MGEFAVLIPYFNPVGYRSHIRKLAHCLESFRRFGLSEHVYLTGAGKRPSFDANLAFWDDDCPFLWHKERLVNLGVHRLPVQYTHVVWADSDLIINAGWAQAVTAAFREAGLVQCFRTAHYRTPDDRYCGSRPNSLRGGAAVGLVWGSCRSLFTSGPGLFDLALVGGGDAVLGMGAALPAPSLLDARTEIKKRWSATLNSRLDAWLAQMRGWLGQKAVAAADVDVEVLEHGPVQLRRYAERHRLLTSVSPTHHLLTEEDRVIRWTEAGLGSVEADIRAYFYNRREDDPADEKWIRAEI